MALGDQHITGDDPSYSCYTQTTPTQHTSLFYIPYKMPISVTWWQPISHWDPVVRRDSNVRIMQTHLIYTPGDRWMSLLQRPFTVTDVCNQYQLKNLLTMNILLLMYLFYSLAIIKAKAGLDTGTSRSVQSAMLSIYPLSKLRWGWVECYEKLIFKSYAMNIGINRARKKLSQFQINFNFYHPIFKYTFFGWWLKNMMMLLMILTNFH